MADDGMEIVMPFVVCQSRGGPYEDTAFAAGWQAGEIDRALAIAAATAPAAAGAVTVRWDMVHAALVPQLELIAMRRGFPRVLVNRTHPDWCEVTFVGSAVDA